MVYGPQFPVNRLTPVDKDRADDQNDPSKKKKNVLYQGRSWSETEEELPIQPKKEEISQKQTSFGMYTDKILLEQAKKFFSQLYTLDAKIAQLFFCDTQAIYDTELQDQLEILLQTWQFGGLVFSKGDYRRETYLISRFQELAKLPLLIGNEFLHGLSFYLQGDSLKQDLTNQHFTDLGKAVMAQNRRMGVQIQFDRETMMINGWQARAFRKGIREAQGIVGRKSKEKKEESVKLPSSLRFVPLEELVTPALSEGYIQETIGYKFLTFFETHGRKALDEELLSAYREHYDAFLVQKDHIADAIQFFCKAVLTGKISEQELDRRVMKILIVKALFYK